VTLALLAPFLLVASLSLAWQAGAGWAVWPALAVAIAVGVVAVGAIGAGAYLLSKDGTCKDGSNDPLRCPDLYENKAPGWGAIAGDERLGGYSHLIRSLRSAEDGLERGLNAGIPWDRVRALKKGAFLADARAKSPPAVQDAR